MSTPTVVVCGSVNVDTFASVPTFPAPGETIIGKRGVQGLGGKGANQAAACAHIGVHTVLFASVGGDSDPMAALALDELQAHGVDVSHVDRTEEPTGQAFIMNDAAGENIIIVTSGANELTSPAAFADRLADLQQRTVVPIILAQGELTPEHSAELPALVARANEAGGTNEAGGADAANEAHPGRQKTRLVVNLAPVTTADQGLIAAADPLVVNEIEAADVTGLPRDTPLEDLFNELQKRTQSAVVTLGAKGAVVITQEGMSEVPSPPVETVVDTTGAGDAFCGTLAAALAEGASLEEAAQIGAAAGSLATQKHGAAASYATRDEITSLARSFTTD